MSKKLILAVVAFTATAMSIAYCAGKKKGLAIAEAKTDFDDIDGEEYFGEKDFCEEDCSECDKCDKSNCTDCLTEADYENKND